jgi:hypothetical protein
MSSNVCLVIPRKPQEPFGVFEALAEGFALVIVDVCSLVSFRELRVVVPGSTLRSRGLSVAAHAAVMPSPVSLQDHIATSVVA